MQPLLVAKSGTSLVWHPNTIEFDKKLLERFFLCTIMSNALAFDLY
jgi:hypothetical protein